MTDFFIRQIPLPTPRPSDIDLSPEPSFYTEFIPRVWEEITSLPDVISDPTEVSFPWVVLGIVAIYVIIRYSESIGRWTKLRMNW